VTDEAPLFDGIDRLKIVFVDGVFDPEQSDDLALEGVRSNGWRCLKSRHPLGARPLRRAGDARAGPRARPLAALNTAFATDGDRDPRHRQGPKPISLIYLHRDETSDAILHHVVRVDRAPR
jgi:Fe-S cluster assembly protein SufD